jgi:hypothetical protein
MLKGEDREFWIWTIKILKKIIFLQANIHFKEGKDENISRENK